LPADAPCPRQVETRQVFGQILSDDHLITERRERLGQEAGDTEDLEIKRELVLHRQGVVSVPRVRLRYRNHA
jgi:hypothetical protein